MPRKTKKEKIIADYRKKIKLLQIQTLPKEQSPNIETMSKPLHVDVQESKQTQLTNDTAPAVNLTYFKTDLKKSLILTIGIITLEILFYFATIKNYLKLN